MRKMITTLCAVAVLAMAVNAMAANAGNGIVWNGEIDKAVAQLNVPVEQGARTNASGPKITSNAHSADFPGIYFIWDPKQKDSGYLKVEPWVFQKYRSFTITTKEANTFWDFTISVQPGQQLTVDGCYVFFIPRAQNNKNINMVFVSEVEKSGWLQTPMVSTSDPLYYYYLQVTGFYNAAQNSWANSNIGRENSYFAALALLDGVAVAFDPDNDEVLDSADYIWGCEASEIDGVAGGTAYFKFVYPVNNPKEIEFSDFYIGADNNFVLFVNGKLAAVSNNLEGAANFQNKYNALTNKGDIDTFFNGVELFYDSDWMGTPPAWNAKYVVDGDTMKNCFTNSSNKSQVVIEIYASNTADELNQLSGQTFEQAAGSNPACVIFAGTVAYKY